MSPRTAAPPPQIPGFTFVKELGQGGFADVYLYQQLTPRREAAVKVLLAEMAGTEAAERLNREADAMAGLSQHQNIVTVFQSGVASDGRPYMAMEYYPRPALSQGLKQSQRSLASVLSIGIQMAGAVESAHRLGIFHRDIKPANILQDRWGHPVLGDFGIAVTDAEARKGGAQGMSIPWSPPESFDADPHPSAQSDIWSLAATVYALLTGHAPFEIPGGDNRVHVMMDRIRNSPYIPTGREDVPPSLEQVLATAMTKSVHSRYPTMKAFGMALREVEQELSLPATRLDIIDDWTDDFSDGDDVEAQGTRLRPITVVDPTGPTGSSGTAPWTGSNTWGGQASTVAPMPSRQWESATDTSGIQVPTGAVSGQVDRTQLRPRVLGEPSATTDPSSIHYDQTLIPHAPVQDAPLSVEPQQVPTHKRWWPIVVIIAVVAVIAAVIIGIVLAGGGNGGIGQSEDTPSQSAVVQDPIGGKAPQTPENLSGTVDEAADTARFTWENPSPQDGDQYRWVIIGDEAITPHITSETQVDVDIPAGEVTVCISVRIVRSGVGSQEAEACAS